MQPSCSKTSVWSCGRTRGQLAAGIPWLCPAPSRDCRRERSGPAPGARCTRCRDAQGQRGELQGNFSQGKRPVVPTRSLPAFCLFSCWRLESGRVPAALPCAARPVPLAGPSGRPCTDAWACPSRIAPFLSSGAGCCAPLAEELRSPQGRAPACVRRASKWGQGFRDFCRATCHPG